MGKKVDTNKLVRQLQNQWPSLSALINHRCQVKLILIANRDLTSIFTKGAGIAIRKIQYEIRIMTHKLSMFYSIKTGILQRSYQVRVSMCL
jgi:hypothetical protein